MVKQWFIWMAKAYCPGYFTGKVLRLPTAKLFHLKINDLQYSYGSQVCLMTLINVANVIK